MVDTVLWLLKCGLPWETVTLLFQWKEMGEAARARLPKHYNTVWGERNNVRSIGEIGEKEDRGIKGDTRINSGEQCTD